MNGKKLMGVTTILVLSLLAMFIAGAEAEGGYTFVTMWPELPQPWYFDNPCDIAVDSGGNVYVADTDNNQIRKLDSDGNFITKWGEGGIGDGQFYSPYGVAVDGSGNVYVADTGNSRIQKFDSYGNFIAKWGEGGTADGQFCTPHGIAVDSSGNVYVVDTGNSRIQKFDSHGNFIAKWGEEGTADGQFCTPHGIAVDSSGTLYAADTNNNRIQKFDSDGNFITKWGSFGTADGGFSHPYGIAADSSDNVFVVDIYNPRIQKFDSHGNFITKWGSYGTGEGEFYGPRGIAVDSSGNVYAADTSNNRIQKFAPGILAKPPKIVSFAPPSPVTDIVQNWRTFSVTVNQTVDVSWYLNDALLFKNESVREAKCTLYTDVAGVHQVSAIASNPNGIDIQNWIWNVAPLGPPEISSFAPLPPVSDTVCNWRTFNVTVNQAVDVSWYLNDALLFKNESVREAKCTLHADVAGEHRVQAIVLNPNGIDMQTWIWNVNQGG